MFGFRFIKVQPTTYVLTYKSGNVVREGAGLSFFYFAPTTSIVLVPVAGMEAPFIFNEVTADFQEVSIQGQVNYRVTDPKKIAQVLNFTLDAAGRAYVSDDPQKLPQRVINVVKVLVRKELQCLSLRQAMASSETLVKSISGALAEAPELRLLGIQMLGLSILAVKPQPETARALETEAREQLLREADQAIYSRRNAAVEQERAIKENELNTEIAVENKKRQIREAQMDAEKAVQEKQHQLQQADMAAKTKLEEKNKELVRLAAENARQQADAQAYATGALVKALAGTDPKLVQALVASGLSPDQTVAIAFQELAQKAEKIGELNISPDLLRELMGKRKSS